MVLRGTVRAAMRLMRGAAACRERRGMYGVTPALHLYVGDRDRKIELP
tara:strand:- start:29 stop:172 length:144 start_codon:yes stop_codon:yes gene_type:complete